MDPALNTISSASRIVQSGRNLCLYEDYRAREFRECECTFQSSVMAMLTLTILLWITDSSQAGCSNGIQLNHDTQD